MSTHLIKILNISDKAFFKFTSPRSKFSEPRTPYVRTCRILHSVLELKDFCFLNHYYNVTVSCIRHQVHPSFVHRVGGTVMASCVVSRATGHTAFTRREGLAMIQPLPQLLQRQWYQTDAWRCYTHIIYTEMLHICHNIIL